jgi:hypothetical protein
MGKAALVMQNGLLTMKNNTTNKKNFLKLISEHDSKTMEDVKRRIKYRSILNIINKFRLMLLNKK